VKICIAQMNYDSNHIDAHVEKIKGIIATYRNYDLIVFPELILHGHPSFEKPEGFLYRKMRVVYRSVSEKIYTFIKENGASVIIGELKRWGDRYYNVATYVDPYMTDSYSKTHVHWTENFTPGKQLKVFDTNKGKIGISICYDAAFSEVWRTLALKGADFVVNISAVPHYFPVDIVWRRLAGAAVFNQVFVIYANRPGEYFSGHSAIFDPKGEIVRYAGRNPSVLDAEIDLDQTSRWREEEPIFPNRRPVLYREISNRHRNETPDKRLDKIYPAQGGLNR